MSNSEQNELQRETAIEAEQRPKTLRSYALVVALKSLVVLGLALLAGLVFALWTWSEPAAKAEIFVSLQHHRPGQVVYSTWEDKLQLQGAAEQVLVQAMSHAGLRSVEQVIQKNQWRLLSGGRLSPSIAAIRAATPAYLGLLGELRCVQVAGAAERGNKQVRVDLHIKAIQLEEQRVLFHLAAEGLADDDDLDRACQKAEVQAAKNTVSPLLDQLQAYRPRSAISGHPKSRDKVNL